MCNFGEFGVIGGGGFSQIISGLLLLFVIVVAVEALGEITEAYVSHSSSSNSSVVILKKSMGSQLSSRGLGVSRVSME
uniref:Uncharacterized protein n=1 Tax=Romanomermis culicivorax TaxID=13658 RepID=A0A915KZ40_ROMCU